MTARRRALVIGAGVAGPATALALHRAGIDATIFESHVETADDVGVMLTVATNGLDALASLDAAGPVLARSFPTPAIRLRSHSGKPLGATATGSTRPQARTSRTIRRADLYRALRDVALERGIEIVQGRRLVAAQPDGAGVRAVFADGSEARGDVLVGCDGVRSTVRRLIDPRSPDRPTPVSSPPAATPSVSTPARSPATTR